MEGGKLQTEERTFFLLLFKTTKICFGSIKMEIFYRERAFHTGKKITKNDFVPLEKFSCYAPATGYAHRPCHGLNILSICYTKFCLGSSLYK